MNRKFIGLSLVTLAALLLSFALVSGAAAQAPELSGDFAVVQAAAEEYLSSEKPPTMSADALFENLNDGDPENDPFILSVRSAEHYALGHVPGAINIPWKQVAKPENLSKLPQDQQILVYCYTGHTGQISTVVLNLLGYDAVNLKFGIMSWTEDDEVLATKRFGPETDQRDYRLETEVNAAPETYAYPELDVAGEDDFEIVRAAADRWLTEAEAPIVSADSVFENLNDGDPENDPLIVSVRSGEHYELGHVPGAVNIPWRDLANPENLAQLPPDQRIVAYCYTGHTGQVAATILGVLGYDVGNMKYGMMAWTEGDEVLVASRFSPDVQRDYRLEEGAAMPELSGDFAVVQAAAEAYLSSDAAPVISADALFENLNDGDPENDPFILSVRSAEHYALGHVPGAVNVPWKQVAKSENLAQLPADQQIVVYCYTGHTGQIATTVLNLLGYDAVNLKFGIMNWTEDDEVLATKRFGSETDQRDYRLETEVNETTETYAYPDLEVAGEDDFEIVRAAADRWLTEVEAPVVSADSVFENLNDGDPENDPLILSVRSAEHYALGHVPTAINIPWRALASPENLAQLLPDQRIVAYCYTGHTGQVAATVLGVLGYDAGNMKYGMMAWTEDDEVLTTTRFSPDVQRDYRLEEGMPEAEEEPTATPEPTEVPPTATPEPMPTEEEPTATPEEMAAAEEQPTEAPEEAAAPEEESGGICGGFSLMILMVVGLGVFSTVFARRYRKE